MDAGEIARLGSIRDAVVRTIERGRYMSRNNLPIDWADEAMKILRVIDGETAAAIYAQKAEPKEY